MNLLEHLRQSPFILAPMASITDCPFRSFMCEMGSSVVTTELVSAKGLERESEKTKRLMSFKADQHPVGVQLFGHEPEILAYACKVIEETGADFVDLNLGCPVPKVVKKGAGSALLKDLPSLAKVLRAMVESVNIPITIKIRTGWDANSLNAAEVADLAYNEGVMWVAIHGRSRSQGYNGRADWDYIGEVKAKSKIAIIGNGDIMNAQQAVGKLHESHCDAVMIGRGALKNPWIFLESKKLLAGEKNFTVERNFVKIFELLNDHFLGWGDERLANLQLRKFSAWFSSGYPGSARFRKNLFQSQDLQETILQVQDYFLPLEAEIQADTSAVPFLMGGHG